MISNFSIVPARGPRPLAAGAACDWTEESCL